MADNNRNSDKPKARLWTREEITLALALYMVTPWKDQFEQQSDSGPGGSTEPFER